MFMRSQRAFHQHSESTLAMVAEGRMIDPLPPPMPSMTDLHVQSHRTRRTSPAVAGTGQSGSLATDRYYHHHCLHHCANAHIAPSPLPPSPPPCPIITTFLTTGTSRSDSTDSEWSNYSGVEEEGKDGVDMWCYEKDTNKRMFLAIAGE